MTRDQWRLADYLAHIFEAIEQIEQYTDDMSEAAFLDNPMAQDAVIRNIEIIGEAGNNIEKYYPVFAAVESGITTSIRLPDAQCRGPRQFQSGSGSRLEKPSVLLCRSLPRWNRYPGLIIRG